MATADIAKFSVYDGRIVQAPPKYQVTKGALSLTNTNYAAISQSASQHTFNLNIPSQSVFIDRGLEWTASCLQSMEVQCQTANPTTYVPSPAAPNATSVNLKVGGVDGASPVAVLGKDWALCSYPLHQLVGTQTATINDTSVVMNTDTVLREVLRLADYKRSRLMKTCPAQLDRYAFYRDANGAVNNPISSYENAYDPDNVPNGAWYDVVYTDATGTPLLKSSTLALPQVFVTPSGNQLAVGGIPVRSPAVWTPADFVAGSTYNLVATLVADPAAGQVAGAGGSQAFYRVYFKWTSTEKLVLSPFVFADQYEWSTGLFGCNNIQLVFNMSADGTARTVRSNWANGKRAIGNVKYENIGSSGPFEGSRVSVQYLTPSLDLDLPAKSVVPYAEYPRYINTNVEEIAAGSSTELQSQTITLPQIPDALIIYARVPDAAAIKRPGGGTYAFSPSTNGAYSPTQVGDFYLPITKISVTFDNFAGILASHTPQQLYQMSVHNGLDMDYNTWRSAARNVASPILDASSTPSNIPLVGGFLVLRMGQDIPLQSGQAPGLVGNFSLQFQVTINNPTVNALKPNLYVISVNTGFFETLAGSSRVVKGLLSEADIISAPPVEAMSSDGLARIVGSGFFDKMGSFLTKHGPALAAAAKPLASAALSALPDEGMAGAVKRGARTMGMGYPTGGGPVGGRLSHRLM